MQGLFGGRGVSKKPPWPLRYAARTSTSSSKLQNIGSSTSQPQQQPVQQPQAPQQSVQQSMLPQSLQQAGNPYAGRASALEAQRPGAQAALDAATRLPDTGEVEAFGRKRARRPIGTLITALAAQEAGNEFKPFSQHYMQQAPRRRSP